MLLLGISGAGFDVLGEEDGCFAIICKAVSTHSLSVPLSRYDKGSVLRLSLMRMTACILRRNILALGHAGGLDVVLCRIRRAEPLLELVNTLGKGGERCVHGARAEMAVGNGRDLGALGGGVGSFGGFGGSGGVFGVDDLDFAVASWFEAVSESCD